ncbi:amino acid ABC transporter permease [Actinomycetospora corticicola]|uniref:Glutamate transport system permease protein n=1 Tax=Actinomycetospora corticicola TaxID=663602 RepID=A0A7Y9J5N3_9PSEU|nr:amino acid ABC transporter permease [Actinomycetospora corticicola]NYD36338.1 glutamate transport system permease protein [Actinomycetospora corticicola]
MSAPTAVLYDVPGPKARARNGALGVVAVIVVAALLAFVIVRLVATGQFEGRVWEWILYENIQLALLEGLLNTLRAFAVGAVLALAFGAVFALGRLSDHAWVRGISTGVVEFFRAVPLVVLMFIFYFGMPSAGITVSTFTAVVLALTLYNGSVLAEIFRSGVQAVPRGQSEAAYALGMRKSAVMRFVLLPQAVRSMLPTIVSQLVVLLKDSALGFLILYPELLYQARVLGSSGQLGRPLLPVAIVVAIVYITLCLLLTALANYLERRTRRTSPAPAVPADGAV